MKRVRWHRVRTRKTKAADRAPSQRFATGVCYRIRMGHMGKELRVLRFGRCASIEIIAEFSTLGWKPD